MPAFASDDVDKVFPEVGRNQAINDKVDRRVEQEEELRNALLDGGV